MIAVKKSGALLAGLAVVLAGLAVPTTLGWIEEPQGVWEPTENYLDCNILSNASECAEWIVQGFVLKACCIPPGAVGTSDEGACKSTQAARGPGGGTEL
ncbi:MAG: hypothetical protein AAF604_23475 [Acidobacteriota bacterium]